MGVEPGRLLSFRRTALETGTNLRICDQSDVIVQSFCSPLSSDLLARAIYDLCGFDELSVDCVILPRRFRVWLLRKGSDSQGSARQDTTKLNRTDCL